MPVILLGIALIAVCVPFIPLHFALYAQISERLYLGGGASVFSKEAAVRRAQKRAYVRGAYRKKTNRKKTVFRIQSVPYAAKLAFALASRLRIERVSVSGSVGTKNAAYTALLCGYVRAAQDALAAVFPDRTDLRVTPDFNTDQSDVRFFGMIRVSVGHIISVGISHIKELSALWKSTRLNP